MHYLNYRRSCFLAFIGWAYSFQEKTSCTDKNLLFKHYASIVNFVFN